MARPQGVVLTSFMSTNSFGTSGLASVCCTWHSVQKYRRGVTSPRTCPSRSMKWVMLIIGAPDPSVNSRLWQDMQRLVLSAAPASEKKEAGAMGKIAPASEHKPSFDGSRRSEEHTSELQSLMRNSDAVFC